ncbi:MAG: ATP phosphoribosyltransferase regulatory subunit [Phycisphaerales bacterium]
MPEDALPESIAGALDRFPAELLRSEHIRLACRRAALRHGFDEVRGAVLEPEALIERSGDAASSDLLRLRDDAQGPLEGQAVVLRRELLPTLARMYAKWAARAPGPARWFASGDCFRGRRPVRGRRCEFHQHACCVFGDETPRADAEVIAAAVAALSDLGLTPQHVKVRISHRGAVQTMLRGRGVAPDDLPAWFYLLDRAGRISNDDFTHEAVRLGMPAGKAVDLIRLMAMSTPFEAPTTQVMLSEDASGRGPAYFKALFAQLKAAGVSDWCVLNLGIVRGAAYYTGMVFEVHDAAGKEQTIAGGGRFDALVEQLGGPATPAAGFAMSDVALGLMLGERGLLPSDAALAEQHGARPHVVVMPRDDSAEPGISPVLATLRRAGLHARAHPMDDSDISDRLLRLHADHAAGRGARFAVILESAQDLGLATLVDLAADGRQADRLTFAELVPRLKQ